MPPTAPPNFPATSGDLHPTAPGASRPAGSGDLGPDGSPNVAAGGLGAIPIPTGATLAIYLDILLGDYNPLLTVTAPAVGIYLSLDNTGMQAIWQVIAVNPIHFPWDVPLDAFALSAVVVADASGTYPVGSVVDVFPNYPPGDPRPSPFRTGTAVIYSGVPADPVVPSSGGNLSPAAPGASRAAGSGDLHPSNPGSNF